jgi:hypothetical protein
VHSYGMRRSAKPCAVSGCGAFHPDLMTPAERLDEIAEILAAGILRLRARLRTPKGSTAEQVRVDFSPRRSGHVAPSGQRRRRT